MNNLIYVIVAICTMLIAYIVYIKLSEEQFTQVITYNNDDGIQLLYKRNGTYDGTFSQQINWYDIKTGDKTVTLSALPYSSASRAYDYTWFDPTIIAKVGPHQHVSGPVTFPVKKIGLTIS